VDEVFNNPSNYAASCGRTSSLVLLCAVYRFYVDSGTCPVANFEKLKPLFRLTPSKVLASNQNKSLPLKPTATPNAGSFCMWRNPDPNVKSYWQEEGAICNGYNQYFAPGITKCGAGAEWTAEQEIVNAMGGHKDKECFDLDLDALDKLLSCSSEEAAKGWSEKLHKSPE
jgi:hypothetical protein